MNNSKIVKNTLKISNESGAPNQDDLELISHYTRKTPDAKDIYTFTVTLCDNEIDRDYERFSLQAINELKSMFEGVTGIFDHSMKSSDQTARIYKTQVIEDNSKFTSCNEPYTRLKAWCYMLRTEKNKDLINEIDAGIKKEISISCSVKRKICSVCKNDIRSHKCNHTHGETIDGNICYAVLEEPTDAYEWSFVAVPAQRHAGVSKSAFIKNHTETVDGYNPEEILKSITKSKNDVTLTPAQIKSVEKYINEMKAHANVGIERKAQAKKEIIALSAFTLPDADMTMMASLLDKLNIDEIFMLRKAFENKALSTLSFEPSLCTKNNKVQNNNAQFKI